MCWPSTWTNSFSRVYSPCVYRPNRQTGPGCVKELHVSQTSQHVVWQKKISFLNFYLSIDLLLKYPDITWNRSNCINPISCMARSPNRCVSSVLVLFRLFITQTLGRRLHNVVEWEKGPAVEHNSSLGLSDDGRWMEINVLDLLRRATSFNGQHKHKKKKRRETKQKRPFFSYTVTSVRAQAAQL
jgi:hypothetical protein